MDNNNKEVTPREFKVGDVVWDSVRYGKGEVKDIDSHEPKILVKFKEDEEWFCSDGRFTREDVIKRLQHQPYRIELLDIPEELPEVGTPVYVWDDDSSSCRIGFFAKKSEQGYMVSYYFPKTGDLYTWKYFSLTLPEQFK